MPTSGINSPSRASEGIVCNTPVPCNTSSAGRRFSASHTASGTAITIAAASDSADSHRCSSIACHRYAKERESISLPP